MKKFPARFWILVLLLGWLFDFLFWEHTPGLSFPLFALAALGLGFYLLRQDEALPASRSLWILPPLAVFLVFSLVRTEPLSAFLAYAFSLALMMLLAFTWRGGLWPHYSLADYLARFFDLLGSMLARPLIFWGDVRKESLESGQPQRPSRMWPIVRGILIAIPVLAFFTALLASADMVFSQRLDEFIKLFRLENLPEYIFRAIYIFFLAYGLAGVYLHAAQRSADEKLYGLEKPLFPPFFGFTEASIVLGSLSALFLSFVIIQFQYFFGGRANISLDGFTYAEYARRGFGELVTVAFLSLALFWALNVSTRRDTPFRQKLFSGLGIALFLLVGVMLISAFQRLTLYETAYGFSRLRTYTHLFILWLAVLLIATAALDVLNRQRAFALAFIATALGFSISILLMNVDGFIVRQNVLRAEQGDALDVGYLASLSPDAVPALVDLYQTPGRKPATHDGIGAALACFQARLKIAPPDASVQAFHFSRYWAAQSLAALTPALEQYQVNEDWAESVTSPLGNHYPCYSWGID